MNNPGFFPRTLENPDMSSAYPVVGRDGLAGLVEALRVRPDVVVRVGFLPPPGLDEPLVLVAAVVRHEVQHQPQAFGGEGASLISLDLAFITFNLLYTYNFLSIAILS